MDASKTPGSVAEGLPSPIDTFALEARAFCAWATGADGSTMGAAAALRHIAALYVAALSLPHPFSPDLSSEYRSADAPNRHLVQGRVTTLPFDRYWEMYAPNTATPEEPAAGSLRDDIQDIYDDVARGLDLFDAGNRADALFEWGFGFRIHWGEHATGALHALHAFLAEQDPEALAQDG